MRAIYILLLIAITSMAAGLHWASIAYFKSQEIEKASARLTLHRNTLLSEIRHFAHLPFLLSQDPVVTETIDAQDSSELDRRLARFAQRAGPDASY
ncbi:MAG: sensor histidine kinase, partial [Dinoroseobacter sp.]|nr:sensor histidine kinase [Dinoroseobacter sp.]